MEIVRLGKAQFIPELSQNATARRIGTRMVRVGDSINPSSPPTGSELTLFHGTLVDPDTMGDYINTNQATTLTDNTGAHIAKHGRPAVSTSSTTEFPRLRSLLNKRQPSLSGNEFGITLMRIPTPNNKAYLFTSARILQELHNSNAHGYVYASIEPPPSAEPFPEREDLDEWRVPEPLKWDYAMKTRVTDLPSGLLVVDAVKDTTIKYLDQVEQSTTHPLEVSEHMEIPVYEFDTWRKNNI